MQNNSSQSELDIIDKADFELAISSVKNKRKSKQEFKDPKKTICINPKNKIAKRVEKIAEEMVTPFTEPQKPSKSMHSHKEKIEKFEMKYVE